MAVQAAAAEAAAAGVLRRTAALPRWQWLHGDVGTGGAWLVQSCAGYPAVGCTARVQGRTWRWKGRRDRSRLASGGRVPVQLRMQQGAGCDGAVLCVGCRQARREHQLGWVS